MLVESRATCAYCQGTIQGAEAPSCPGCHAAHHDDCWRENGGCSVVGCGSGPVSSPRHLYVDSSTGSLSPAFPSASESSTTEPPRAPGSAAVDHPAQPQMLTHSFAPTAPGTSPYLGPTPSQPADSIADAAFASRVPVAAVPRRRNTTRLTLTVVAMIIALAGVGAVAYQQGRDAGADEGFDRGFSQGETAGFNDGWDVGYDEGHADGQDTGFDTGWDEGWDLGYDAGVSCGVTTYYEWEC